MQFFSGDTLGRALSPSCSPPGAPGCSPRWGLCPPPPLSPPYTPAMEHKDILEISLVICIYRTFFVGLNSQLDGAQIFLEKCKNETFPDRNFPPWRLSTGSLWLDLCHCLLLQGALNQDVE